MINGHFYQKVDVFPWNYRQRILNAGCFLLQASQISDNLVCGVTKGCFREPEGCTGGADCTIFAGWHVDEDGNNKFTLSGEAAGYVALGFSKSGGMVSNIVYL